jgi:hypothetical protein
VILLALPVAAGPEGDLLSRWEKTSRFTLKAKGIRVEEAIERICKETGQEVRVDAKKDQRIELELLDATFLEAVDAVAERAGLALQGPGRWEEGGLRLVARPDGMKRVAPVHSGPVRLALLGIYAERNAAWRFEPDASEADGAPRKLWAELGHHIEKGLDEVILHSVELDAAVDDADQSLIERRTFPAEPDEAVRIELKAGAAVSLKVREMRGRAVFMVPREITELKFAPGGKNVSKSLGKANFTLVRLARKGEGNQPELTVTLEGTPCADLTGEPDSNYGRVEVVTGSSWWRRRPEVAILVYDKSGNEIGSRRSDVHNRYDGTPPEYVFGLEDHPHRIVVRAITEVVRKEVAFRFDDLPIPR